MTRNYANGCVAKNHGKWLAIITWQEDGKQRRMTKTTGVHCYEDKIDEKTGKVKKNSTDKALAEAVLRAWRDELVAAESAGEEVRGSELTVREYVLSYIEDKERAGTVRDVTTKGYRTALGHLTGTGLGDARMADVTHREIMDWEQGLVEEGLAPATISHIHVFLKQVFAWARKVGDLAGNPFDLVEAPKRVAKPINALPPSEAKRLREALEGFGPSPLATAVGLAIMTGMRQGEICALRWQDVDLEANIIHVNHALTRVSGRFELAAPKTATSRRTIPFGARLKQALVARKESMQADVAERAVATHGRRTKPPETGFRGLRSMPREFGGSAAFYAVASSSCSIARRTNSEREMPRRSVASRIAATRDFGTGMEIVSIFSFSMVMKGLPMVTFEKSKSE
nr:tyrosine-type recombinase/integrase [Paratractidigestivibacter sp.]